MVTEGPHMAENEAIVTVEAATRKKRILGLSVGRPRIPGSVYHRT